jgi:hypothetical protein
MSVAQYKKKKKNTPEHSNYQKIGKASTSVSE